MNFKFPLGWKKRRVLASLASFQQIETFVFKIELGSGSEKRDGLVDASFKKGGGAGLVGGNKFESENQSELDVSQRFQDKRGRKVRE